METGAVQSRSSSLSTFVTVVLVLCAVITTGLVVRREFFPSPSQAGAPAPEKPTLLDNWQAHLTKGVRMGPADAPVQLIEFADFECPFCASFHEQLKSLRKRYPTQVALTFVHLPLEMHRFAEPAARVAECAGEQGRFEAMYDQLFTWQKEMGLKPWSEYATSAGVPDTVAFESCIKRTEPVPQIEAGKQLSKELQIKGTPTLIVNGWKLGQPPQEQELDKMVESVLAGKPPVST